MIVSHILGGIGNQMFQYAAGRALSCHVQQTLLLDTRDFASYTLHQGFELERVFALSATLCSEKNARELLGWRAHRQARRILRRPECSWLRGQHYIQEPQFNFWPEFFNLPADSYLCGYWQSELYFNRIEQVIRADFAFREPLTGQNQEIATELARQQSVSLHVRRGDYISDAKASKVMNVCSLEYYQRAISHICTYLENPVFYVFSDDMAWVRRNLQLNHPCHYIDFNQGQQSYRDMQLMSLCKHNIIANSSFSWWGAWLNANADKRVVAPQNWFVDGKTSDKDLVPQNWLRL